MMQNLTPQERDAVKAGAVLAVLLIAGAMWYNVKMVRPEIKKNTATLTKLNDEIKKLNETLEEFDLAAKNLKALQAKQEMLAKVAQKLPKTIDPQGFYRALDKMLAVTRVEYTDLAQQKLVEYEVYTEIPYKIVSKARYHDFGQFLNLVEENPDRLMRVKEFYITNQENRPSVHPITVMFATFMFKTKG